MLLFMEGTMLELNFILFPYSSMLFAIDLLVIRTTFVILFSD